MRDGIGWDGSNHQKPRAAVHGRITHRQHAQMRYPERVAKPLLALILPDIRVGRATRQTHKEGEMPAEKFYPPYADPIEHFEIGWHRDYDGVHLTMVTTPEADDHPAITVSVPMDRSAINRLIRVLRKARDQTYGSDE